MPFIPQDQTTREPAGPGRERYLSHTDNLMMVVLDFRHGPMSVPDPHHHHPHEQITYLVSGELTFFLGDEAYPMKPGDMITVPPDVPHTVQVTVAPARVIDVFTPLRQEFLGK